MFNLGQTIIYRAVVYNPKKPPHLYGETTAQEVCTRRDIVLKRHTAHNIKVRLKMLLPDGLRYKFLTKERMLTQQGVHVWYCN